MRLAFTVISQTLIVCALFLAPGALAQKQITKFPGISQSGLDVSQKQQLASMLNEEPCPCACAMSFAKCLQGDQCKPATLLANWIVEQMRGGVPQETLATQVTNEVAAFSKKPVKLAQAGFNGRLGKRDARHVVVEFADFECPHCKFASPEAKRAVKESGGNARLVFKHFPLAFHAMAPLAAAAAEAAGEQGRFWEMHDALFATQQMLDEDLIRGHAKALGLDVERFELDFKSPGTAAKVQASRAEGERVGIQATPTFYIDGRPFELMRTHEAFGLRLKMEDARKSARCEKR